jgi:hypothetical protein
VTEALTERYRTGRRLGALASVAITLLILGVGFAVFRFTPAVVATLYAGMAAACVAIPYTVVAVIAREFSGWRSRHEGETGPDGALELGDEAICFGMFRQRASLTMAIVMLVALAVLAAVPVGIWSSQPSNARGLLGNGDLLAFGVFATVAGALAVVVNVPSIYSRRVVGSERYAIRHRVGAWKLVLANTILTTSSWIAYCGFAVYFLSQLR